MTLGESIKLALAKKIAIAWPQLTELTALAILSENWEEITDAMMNRIVRIVTTQFGPPTNIVPPARADTAPSATD
jgi:hypothetical protein